LPSILTLYADYELSQLFETLSGQYTVLLFSDPNEFRSYEPNFVEPVHMDLKRDAGDVFIGRRADGTKAVPLFEKYQFFTPGLCPFPVPSAIQSLRLGHADKDIAVFMGLLTLIIVLSILGAGLKALSSLEVSYGAFDKDMGPAAQKKQM
jgi:hypothetical protein